MYELGKRGVQAFKKHIHSKQERSLHPESTLFDEKTKNRLLELSAPIDKKWGFGYKVAGVLALGEHLGAMSLAGLLLILGGSWLSTATARQVA